VEVRTFLAQFVNIFAELLIFAIFIRVILSWIRPVNASSGISRFLFEITEPVLSIFRRVVPRLGMLDISPIIAFIVIELIRSVLVGLLLPIA